MSIDSDPFVLAGVTLSSRFLLGTAGYPSPQVLQRGHRRLRRAGGHRRPEAPSWPAAPARTTASST